MRKPITITGLDIGSSRVCAAVHEIEVSGSHFIRGVHTGPSAGVERGHIVDLDLAVGAVSKVLERLEEKTGKALSNLYVNISGSSISAQKTRGMVSLSIRGREITEADMKRCVNVASTIRLPFECDIIHKIVHSYLIDDQTETMNPLGLYGSRLAVELYAVTASINHIQNLQKVVHDSGYELKEVVFSGLADAHSVIADEERHADTLLVDMGSSLTEISLFHEGVMWHIEVMPFGVSDIRAPLESDENLAKAFERIKAAADELSSKGAGVGSIVLVGGGSLADGMIELVEARLGRAARQGVVKSLSGEISPADALSATTAIGLTRYAAGKYAPAAKAHPKNLIQQLSSKVVDVFNNYF